ncbi:benzoylformate decarboxylase [Roseomonas sp. OT10]|uniref:benzoylformate decarboxylase n=1 Tax=Roseomonas cutis TaxID=2897332 RepID=UPI001E3DA3BF|nr:benzoylformate decarboxylase [Roseomonas sp. OT10]UFN47542.1 benzoylformate decarboxylase [Roseomonas sp. OT10]
MAQSPSGGMTTVRQAVLDLLRQLGMTTVFGNPGSTELPLLDRWPEDFRYILGLQEASVVGMADGYARATGRAAFVNLHSAAGVGHALGNVFTAWRNQAPLVISAGQQVRALLPNHPFLGAQDAAQFPKPYVKFSIEPARAEDVPAAIAHAHHVAMQKPCGPTFVSIPVDDWAAPCRAVVPRIVSADVAPDPALIAEAVRLLVAARRPVLVVGPEVDQEGAGAAMVALAERIGAPVLASPFSSRLSFPEDHALFAGFLAAAPQAVSQVLSAYDLVLVIGAPVFTFHVGGEAAIFRDGPPILQLTADAEAAAAAPAGTGIVGSLRLALPALHAALPPADRPPPAPRRRAAPPPPAEPIPAAWLLHRLHAALPGEAILVEEAPSHRPAMQEQLPRTRWGSFFTMASGGLGYSLPAAVGIALARPGERVVALIGDGSMMYSPQALWTAVQHGLPLTVVVVNNGGYGAMRSFSQVLQVRDVPGIDLPGLDFVALARSMGCPGQRVTRPEELDGALHAACRSEGPALVEVVVDAAIPTLYHRG